MLHPQVLTTPSLEVLFGRRLALPLVWSGLHRELFFHGLNRLQRRTSCRGRGQFVGSYNSRCFILEPCTGVLRL